MDNAGWILLTGNKKTIYVNGLLKTMSYNIINKLG